MSEKSEHDAKLLQSYLNTIKDKTGKSPDDFRALAKKKGLTTYSSLLHWLKTDFGLGHGHANLIAHMVLTEDGPPKGIEEELGPHFKGAKAKWRKTYDGLIAKVSKFGSDVEIAPNNSYINLVRGTKKFGIVQISTADRMDIGLKLKGVAPEGRLEAAGSWNSMVTHRVRVGDAKQIDSEVLAWLKKAYAAV